MLRFDLFFFQAMVLSFPGNLLDVALTDPSLARRTIFTIATAFLSSISLLFWE